MSVETFLQLWSHQFVVELYHVPTRTPAAPTWSHPGWLTRLEGTADGVWPSSPFHFLFVTEDCFNCG